MARDETYGSEFRTYAIGLVLALVLSAVPFALVFTHALPRSDLLWVIALAAIMQLIVHFRCFLHIDLSRSKRDDLQLILFSGLIVVIMVGGTIWIISNQAARMMIMGSG